MSEPDATLDSPAAPGPRPPWRSGEYIVVARRYRPQAFAELVGQKHVAGALSGAISSQRVGHAYLFTGARGVGKTSAARILAKALNCVEGPTPLPCNRCDVCERISSGDDLDVLEIDGASNRGIDEMRELRQNVNVRPSRARFKIYIIDEVHMLTKEAFNALLKTLEEPPEHVKFIFCTTEPEKIPITILSRCQRFDFAGIQTSSIVERLRQIVAAEGVAAEPEALEILARRAAGSMRDSQSLLEQLLAFAGPTITVGDVHRMLGTAEGRRLSQLAGCLVERDAAAALGELDAALAEGVDIGPLVDQLLGFFRDLMVAAAGCPPEAFLHVLPSEAQAVLSAGGRLGLESVLAILQILDQTAARLRWSTHGRLLTELAVVRICKLEHLEQLADLVSRLKDGMAPPAGGGSPKTTARPARVPGDEPAGLAAPHEPARPMANNPPNPSATAQLTAETAERVWKEVLRKLSDMLAEHASLYERVAIIAPNRLVVSFPAKYTSCKTFCERPHEVARLEQALADLTGQPLRLEFALVDDGPAGAAGSRRAMTPGERLLEKSQHPLVRRATELFDARPVRLEEPEP